MPIPITPTCRTLFLGPAAPFRPLRSTLAPGLFRVYESHRMNTRTRFARAGAAALLGGAAAGCAPSPDQRGALPSRPKVVGVVTATRGDIARTITQPGTMQGIEEAVLFAKTSGYLKTIYVDKGDRVHAGQLLALIESPELAHQQAQAQSTFRQSQSNTLGVVAAKGRAQADVVQAAAGVERAKADTLQEDAAIGRARADQARTEAQLPRLQALAQEADANVQQAAEQQAQAQSEVARWQQQLKAAQASTGAAQASLEKAQADFRLAQATYNRFKAVQDKDDGLIAAQQVDEARARMEATQSEVAAARKRLDAAGQDAGAVEQQIESARRSAAAAGKKIEASRSHAAAVREEIQVARQEVETARQQVKVAETRRDSVRKQVGVAEAQERALRTQIPVADAQIAASRQQGQGSRSAMSAAADLASYTRIVAPFDGLVTERLADAGALVQNVGGQAGARGILKVVRDQTLRVLIPVPELDVPRVRTGGSAVLQVDAYPKDSFTGTITRFASAVDPKSRTMLTEVDLPNPGGRLRPGMYVRVTLTLETHRNALSLPSEAVMGKDDDRFVYTVKENTAHKTPVKTGVDDGKMVEVTEGLAPGVPVILTGRDTVVDGGTVKAEPAKVEPKK